LHSSFLGLKLFIKVVVQTRINSVLAYSTYGVLMTADDSKNELSELRERIVRLETRMDEVNKRLDGIAKYLKELYDYLQKRHG